MHDRTIHEELEKLASDLDHFKKYCRIKEDQQAPNYFRNHQADVLFRRNMPQTAAGLIMRDLFSLSKKPIDHPYLLPPASGLPNIPCTGSIFQDVRKTGDREWTYRWTPCRSCGFHHSSKEPCLDKLP